MGIEVNQGLTVNDTTESTDYQTGSVIVKGGVGIAKNLHVHGETVLDGDLTIPAGSVHVNNLDSELTTVINTVAQHSTDIAALINTSGTPTQAAASAAAAAASAAAAHQDALDAAAQASAAAASATQGANSATSAAASQVSATAAAADAADALAAAIIAQGDAETAATTATIKAGNASVSASQAATSATNAAGSASTASTAATTATTAATNAGNSANAAVTSASNAASSATGAGNSASQASTNAGVASTSATNAANSATAAATSSSQAATSATNAATSATTASNAATTATTQANAANTSAANAATSASAASNSATQAASSATSAAGSASAASNSASIATGSATTAGTSATAAANSATIAQTAATNAANSATASVQSYNNLSAKIDNNIASLGGNYVGYSTYNAGVSGNRWLNNFPAGATITQNIGDPTGGTEAVRFTGSNTTNALLRVEFPAVTANGTDTYTCSFYARLISGSNVNLKSDLADKTTVFSLYFSKLIVNEWVRIDYSGIPTAGSLGWIDLVNNLTLDVVIDFWGVQVEKGKVPTAYIKTAGTPVISRSTVQADLVTEQSVRASADTAISNNVTALTSTVNTKTRVFRQSTQPTPTAVGDAWFDTGNNNKLYIWNGTAWTLTQDNTKNTTFYQGTAPTALAVGDLWVDTANSNSLKRWNGTSWVAVDNAQIATTAAALTTEQTTRANADTALANSITSLSATVSTEITDRTNGDAANAATIATTNANLVTEQTTRATADAALSQSLLDLSSSISGGFSPYQTWNFTSGVDTWTSGGCTIAASGGYLTVTSSSADPIIRVGSLSITGSQYFIVKARVKRTAGTNWDGKCYYTTGSHGESGLYYKQLTNPGMVIGQWYVLEWAMDALTVGGTDWTSNIITGIRFDLGAAANDVFVIDWISIGSNAPPVSYAEFITEQTTRANAVSAVSSSVTSLNSSLSTEITNRINGDNALQTSLNTTNANLVTEQTTRANADTAISNSVTSLTATVNTKARVYRQSTQPTGTTVGDIWINTSSNNLLKVWDGTAWQTTQDNSKNTTFYQGTAPTAVATGDLWIDTANNNSLKRWNGTSWVAVDNAQIATTAANLITEQTTRANADNALASDITALTTTVTNNYNTLNSAITTETTARTNGDSTNATAITNLTSTVNTKARVFRQGTQPTATATGDIWINTSSNNLLKVWDGTVWQTSQDNSKNTTFYQGTAPTAVATGDLWVDTANSNSLKRWNGTSWVAVDNTSFATSAALTTEQTTRANADTAISNSVTSLTATVNTKARVFRQGTQPTATATGDIWINTSSNNLLKVWDGTAWQTTQDNSKNTTFYQGTAPTAIATGDLWVDTANSNSLKRWNGTSWVAVDNTSFATSAALTTEQTTRANADIALSSTLTSLRASFDGAAVSASVQPPNSNLDIEDASGKPLGIEPVDNITVRTGVAFGDANKNWITLVDTVDSSIAYGFPAIAIDDNLTYTVTVTHKSPTTSTTGLYIRMNELNTDLPAGFTHVGSGGGSLTTTRTGYKDLQANGPLPGTTWVTNTFTYTPTAGTRFASLSFYKWSALAVNVEYHLMKATVTSSTDGIVSSIASTNAAITSEATTRANADTAISNTVSTLTSTVNTKARVYRQSTQPTGTTVGDIWINTSSNNLLKVWDGTAWQTTQDNSKNTTFYQGTAPTAVATGDLWIDTANNNSLKRWNGTAWVAVDNTSFATSAALTTEQTTRANADTAISNSVTSLTATVNTKARVYRQSTQPTGTTVGDIWIDSDDNNKMRVWDGTTWNLSQDNTKNTTFYQGTAPTALAVGDLWVDSANGNSIKRWNGTAWVAVDNTTFATSAALTTEQNTRATADTALSNSITSLTATVTNNYNTLNSAITTETSARTTADNTNATAITTLSSRVGASSGVVSGNLLKYSEDLSNAVWIKSANTAVSSNTTTSPIGDNTADKLYESTTTSSQHYIYQNVTIPAGTNTTFSVYAKSGERSYLYIGFGAASGSPKNYTVFNLNTGTVVGTPPSALQVNNPPQIDDVGGGWWRISVGGVVSASETSVNAVCYLYNGSTATYAGTANWGLYLWGMQWNIGAAAAPYLATTSTAVSDGSSHYVDIQTLQTTTNGLSGQYTVKINNNNSISGFGLASTAVNGTPTSAFVVSADEFAIVDPNVNYTGGTSPSVSNIPFQIVGGVTYIKSANINTATIKTLHLADASVVNSVSVTVNGTSITSGSTFTTTTYLTPPASGLPADRGWVYVIAEAEWLANASAAYRGLIELEYSLDLGATWTPMSVYAPQSQMFVDTSGSTTAGFSHVMTRFISSNTTRAMNGVNNIYVRATFSHSAAGTRSINFIQLTAMEFRR